MLFSIFVEQSDEISLKISRSLIRQTELRGTDWTLVWRCGGCGAAPGVSQGQPRTPFLSWLLWPSSNTGLCTLDTPLIPMELSLKKIHLMFRECPFNPFAVTGKGQEGEVRSSTVWMSLLPQAGWANPAVSSWDITACRVPNSAGQRCLCYSICAKWGQSIFNIIWCLATPLWATPVLNTTKLLWKLSNFFLLVRETWLFQNSGKYGIWMVSFYKMKFSGHL